MKSPDQGLLFKGKQLSKSWIRQMDREDLIKVMLEHNPYIFSSAMVWIPLIYLRNTLIREVFNPEELG